MEERSSNPRTAAEDAPEGVTCCAVILVDLTVPESVSPAAVQAVFARLEQEIRFRAQGGGVLVEDVHARVLGLTTGQILAAFDMFATPDTRHE